MSALKKEQEIFDKLKGLQEDYIRGWLEDIKKGADKDNKVPNLLTGRLILTNSIGGTYQTIIKWCIKKYPTYDFTNIPNFKEISKHISGSPAAATATPAAAAAAKANSPVIDYILIAKMWKDTPTIDPFTGNKIAVSINPTSKYVAVYSKIIDGLTKQILQTSSKLSVENCKFIKECMPDVHAIYNTDTDTIYYDHLLFKNFLEKHAYDEDYLKEMIQPYKEMIQPYLYSHIYKVVNATLTSYGYTDYNNVGELLENFCSLSFDSDNPTFAFTIGYMIERMCKDIKNILYMHESKITSEQINQASFNKEVIKYFISIVKLHLKSGLILNKSLRIEIRSHLNHNKLKYEVDDRKNEFHFIDYIYGQFVDHFFPKKDPYNPTQYVTDKDVNVCDTLLPVYDCILKLYSDNSIKNAKYKYVKDPYNINKVEEPQYPVKIQQLPPDLQRYKTLSSRSNYVKDSAIELQIKQIEEKNQRIFDDKVKKYESDKKEYDKKKEEYDKKFNEEIKKYEQKKEEYDKLLKNNLKVNKEKHKGFDKILKEKIKKYKKDKDIHDRIYKGKFSPKPNIGKWMGEALKMNKKHNSANDVKVPKALSANAKAFGSNKYKRSSSAPKVSFVKYDSKLKKFKLNSAKDKHISRSSDKIEYINTEDPFTKEPFDEMHEMKQKYSSDIVSYDKKGKAFHHRFETINLYNHILKCIENCEKPINPDNRVELTDENLEEICHKIKFFAYKPTFNSHIQINALLNNCKHDNLLAFSYDIENRDRNLTPANAAVIGKIHIFLVINLGGILFRVINKIPPYIKTFDDFPVQSDFETSAVLVLPNLNPKILRASSSADALLMAYEPTYVLLELQKKLQKGDMLGVKYFPYRKNNKDGELWNEVVKLPEFKFSYSDTKYVVFEKLKDYKDNQIAVL